MNLVRGNPVFIARMRIPIGPAARVPRERRLEPPRASGSHATPPSRQRTPSPLRADIVGGRGGPTGYGVASGFAGQHPVDGDRGTRCPARGWVPTGDRDG